MASFKPNTFTSYSLSESEERSGRLLNLQQQQVIQNMCADIAQQRLNLDVDILNPGDFCLNEAYLKGQLQAYQYLLELSKEEEEAVLREAQSQVDPE